MRHGSKAGWPWNGSDASHGNHQNDLLLSDPGRDGGLPPPAVNPTLRPQTPRLLSGRRTTGVFIFVNNQGLPTRNRRQEKPARTQGVGWEFIDFACDRHHDPRRIRGWRCDPGRQSHLCCAGGHRPAS